MVDGFDQVPFGDLEAVEARDRPGDRGDPDRADQGEGGVRVVAAASSCGRCAQLCDEHGLLLIFDEVQTGIGRTGELFAYQRTGVTPDIMALAKALGGGFPLGACLATAEAAKGMTAGTHGSTFGGNPLAMAAGNAVLDVVLAAASSTTSRGIGAAAQAAARRAQGPPSAGRSPRCAARACCSACARVVPNGDLVDALRAEKLLTVAAGDNVVRLLPPLIVSEAEIAEAVARLDRACARLAEGPARPRKQGAAG